MSTRLNILKASLEKKKEAFDSKLQNHFATVQQANGQPLNDKRNGRATLKKWERQNDALRSLDASLEKTKVAIEKEEWKISRCENALKNLPQCILDALERGVITQWRKHPNTFFVTGVDRARLVFYSKKKAGVPKAGLYHRYTSTLEDEAQKRQFIEVYKMLVGQYEAENL